MKKAKSEKKEVKELIKNLIDKLNNGIQDFSGLKLNLTTESTTTSNYTMGMNLKSISGNYTINSTIVSQIASKLVLLLEEKIYDTYIDEKKLNDIIEKLSYMLIFDSEKIDEKRFDEIYKLNRYLNQLSLKTYENHILNLGILLVQDKEEASDILEKLKVNFIPITKNVSIQELIRDEKPLIKLIDTKSIVLVVNRDFRTIGFARKSVNGKSIDDIILKRYFDIEYLNYRLYALKYIEVITGTAAKNAIIKYSNEGNGTIKNNKLLQNMEVYREKFNNEIVEIINNLEKSKLEHLKYIRIINNEIQWYSNNNYVLTSKNYTWKLKHYILLSAYIFEYINPPNILVSFILGNVQECLRELEHDIKKIAKLISTIRKMTEENIGGLFVILKPVEDKNTIARSEVNNLIPNDLVKNSDQKMTYRELIYNNESKCLSMSEIDDFLLKLIAGVDGATLLDSELNVLSFGEIINNNNNIGIKDKSFGARTNAAISASFHGIAIKVSEDGEIEIFEDGRSIFKI